MDILLINPRTELLTKPSYNREPPNGLLSIAMYLKLKGLDVKVVDYNDSELLNTYLDLQPKIIGVTCLTNTYNTAINIINWIKNQLDDVKIVLGGPHATFMWNLILKTQPNVDYVICGEGEYPLYELFKNIKKGKDKINIRGVAYRYIDSTDKSKIISNGFADIFDVNLFPYPERLKLIPNKYDVASIIVNRGCPYNCSFCVRQKLFRKVRFRNPINIVSEMKYVETLGYSFANLYDNINLDLNLINEICKLIQKENVSIPWGAELRGDNLSFDLAKKLKNSGCRVIAIGVETANKHTLLLNGKFQSLEKVREGIINAKKAGLSIQCFFIIGLPGDTIESFDNTINFIENLPLIPGEDRLDFFIATPYPGSRLFEEQDKFKLRIIDTNWDHWDTEHIIFETDTLKYHEISELYLFAKKYSEAFNS